MKTYTNARIVVVEENHFTNENGENVDFFTTFLKGKDRSVLKINSGKLNFSDMEGEEGVAEIEITEQNAKLKAKLISFQPKEALETPKGIID